MTKVADYSILSDGKLEMKIGADIDKTLSFSLPKSADLNQRGILMFMLDTVHPDNLKFHIDINGKKVFTGQYSSDVYHSVHEVINTGILKAGSNTCTFTVDGGKGALQVGDVTVWYQNNASGQ
jgi:hypothetical protein